MKRIVVLVFLVLSFSVIAQETNDKEQGVAQETNDKEHSVAQLTFIYPIGSNGVRSLNYNNNFSFNVLFGLNGGVSIAEMGGIFNYNDGAMKGIQLAGTANLNKGNVHGLMFSGIAGITFKSLQGASVSGVLNFSTEDSKGLQFGTANISVGGFSGLQFGVINFSGKLKGLQIGVLNYQGDNKGISFGVVNVAKGGLFQFELLGGDVIYSNLNYKMGVERFYTVYKLGYSSYKSNPVYSVGLGFGHHVTLSEKHGLDFCISGNQIIYNNQWNGKINRLYKLDMNYKYSIKPNLSVLVGPSLNHYQSGVLVENDYGTLNIPYTISTDKWSNGKAFFWIGFNLGITYNL